ncbi:MAG: cytochrome P450 [Alphaproteobacteria bacterium]|nr:cytochrome P450 [Alphaproteobacteria bacterium]
MNKEATGCPFKSAAEINFMDPVVQENWFDAYDVLREEAPVYFMPEIGMYVLTRYEDIEYVVRRPELFTAGPDVQSTEPLIKYPANRALYEEKGWRRYTPLGENLPKHEHYRGLVDPKLTMTAVRQREPFIRATINELIDTWIDKGEIEFMKEFAEPLPMIVIAELLGFPRMDLPKLKEWSFAWVWPFSRGLTEEQERWAVERHIELQHYIFETMKEKRKNPKDDIITHLTQTEIFDVELDRKRPLHDNEIIGITDHLLIGGNETTTFAISNGLWLLFRFPEVYAELQADRSKVKTFVEEVLRLESPTQGLYRFVTEDVEIGGVKVPKGATLSIRYGAGNHDYRKFPDPDVPKLDRRNAGRHLAFSLGEHHCPGASLSRFEQNCAWDVLLQRVKNMRPVEAKNDYGHVHGMWLRALKELHITFDKA